MQEEREAYLIMNSRYGLELSLTDHRHAGFVSAGFWDFGANFAVLRRLFLPFTRGWMGLPSSFGPGKAAYKCGRADFLFHHKGEKIRLQISFLDFCREKGERLPLEADFLLTPANGWGAAAAPAGADRNSFPFPPLPMLEAEGWLRLGKRQISFFPEQTQAFLDWNRGRRAFVCRRLWSGARGLAEGEPLALTFEKRFQGTGSQKPGELRLFYNDTLCRLDKGEWTFVPEKTAQVQNSVPHTAVLQTSGCRLTFCPFWQQRVGKGTGLFSRQDLSFGYFDGHAQIAGKHLNLHKLPGFLREEVCIG